PLSDAKTFTLVVNEVNTAPLLNPISDRTVSEGALISFTAIASDPDIPAQTLTFSLDPEAPSGAHIDPTNGLFTWTPTEAQGPSTNTITVRVTDNGSPALSDAKSFTVTVSEVNSAPSLQPIDPQTVIEGEELMFAAITS